MPTKVQQSRRRAVRGCLAVTKGTTLAADYYELRLLIHFIRGELSIDQVCSLLEVRAARREVS